MIWLNVKDVTLMASLKRLSLENAIIIRRIIVTETGKNKRKKQSLSKSLYIKGLQCHKALYLHKYKPELKDETSSALEARFRQGNEVGKLAQKLFPGGIEIPYEKNNYDSQAIKTAEAFRKGKKIIYEATFSFHNVFVKIDILKKGVGGWEIYEVKSSVKTKGVHIDDTAIQYYVAAGSGLRISKAYLVLLNDEYVRSGEIEPEKLFRIEDISEKIIEKQPQIPRKIKEIKKALQGDMPDIDIGKYCNDPYKCFFHGHCWEMIPNPSIFNLGGKGIDKFAYYRDGIIFIKDIPLDALNRQQKIQAVSYLNKKWWIDKEKIKAFLSSITYPVHFLDFETFSLPIPAFDGASPFTQIPFQYSLHYQKKKNGKVYHSEYLADPTHDYREDLLRQLLVDLSESSCILAYSSKFERDVLTALIRQFPKYEAEIEAQKTKILDLAAIFSTRDVYHYKMNGKYSLKAVLPVLVPNLSYKNLEVQDGGMAMESYFKMTTSDDKTEVAQIRKNLLEYCKLDTLAMVKLLEKLRAMI